ncbi:MAG: DUF1428 domain-containing protein [Pseudomonadota bacterium]
MAYVDGYLIAVPAANREAYMELARKSAPLFKKYGASRVVENWGDDVPDGKVTSFAMATKAKPDEVIVFSWVEWPSKEARDDGMKKAMEDPFFAGEGANMPFDGMRMMFGGFETILDE